MMFRREYQNNLDPVALKAQLKDPRAVEKFCEHNFLLHMSKIFEHTKNLIQTQRETIYRDLFSGRKATMRYLVPIQIFSAIEENSRWDRKVHNDF